MTTKMLIDATHSEETRVAVVRGNRLEEYDVESSSKKQLKGNVYLAKITRVEPSLQAAFVEYGGNRHGFLAFNEIHPDYYQIPVADREKLLADERKPIDGEDREEGESVETIVGDDLEEEVERRRHRSLRGYKIQEVIKRRQIMLVQVVKEERGNKGAALTTYLSLAGRYCVLMPNTARGGGISRKIANAADRKRLKNVLDEIKIPEGMAVIVRTAGAGRSKAEIKRDYEYLLKRWDEIRTTTLQSTAPTLIHEEANLIKRAVRDLYTKDIDEILVEGDDGYRLAKDFMRTLTPSHARKVQQYKNGGIPLLHRYQIEYQIDAIHDPVVQLASGGYIVIHPTEALVSIDVNSGRSTRERNIEETALKTNLEAAAEIARQLRLRDLAGLIVIDFIDMEVARNVHAVERRMKEALKSDRARIQVGRISHFGLLEMSRQRLRPSVMEAASQTCPTCGGVGFVRSVESSALHLLRAVEEEGIRRRSKKIAVEIPTNVALYVLNQKRTVLAEIEQRYDFRVEIRANDTLIPPHFELEQLEARDDDERDEEPEAALAAPAEKEATLAEKEEEQQPRGRRGRRRRGRKGDAALTEAGAEVAEPGEADVEDGDAAEPEQEAEATGEAETDEDGQKRPRRRGRRGGRRRRPADRPEAQAAGDPEAMTEGVADAGGNEAQPEEEREDTSEAASEEERRPRRRPRRRRKAGGSTAGTDEVEGASAEADGAEPKPLDIEPAPAMSTEGAVETGGTAEEVPVPAPESGQPPEQAPEWEREPAFAFAGETGAEPRVESEPAPATAEAASPEAMPTAGEGALESAQESAQEIPPVPAEDGPQTEPQRQPDSGASDADAHDARPARENGHAEQEAEQETASRPEREPEPEHPRVAEPDRPKRTGWWQRVLS